MRIGFHSPLPPLRTGVADYASALLAALRRRGAVELGSRGADVCLYHLGNNALHREIYRRALARPGVAVMHDSVLHHFYLGTLERTGYLEEFVFNYGEWRRGLAEELWAERAGSMADRRYFDHPMLRRAAEASRAVIVHNPAAARAVLAHAPRARVHRIPHLFAPPPPAPAARIEERRRELGVPGGAFLFAVLGYLREARRLPVIFRAFEEVRRQGVDAVLLIAGEFVSTDLATSVARWLKRPDVLRLGWTPDRDFWLLAAVADACINLRYPGAGETSGVAVRLMGLGKPVIVTDSEAVSEFPPAACLRVEHGVAEQAELVHHMMLLAQRPELAREVGRQAAAYICREHSIEAAADLYWEVLCACRN